MFLLTYLLTYLLKIKHIMKMWHHFLRPTPTFTHSLTSVFYTGNKSASCCLPTCTFFETDQNFSYTSFTLDKKSYIFTIPSCTLHFIIIIIIINNVLI